MRRFTPRKSHKLGLSPGSLVPVEVPREEPVRLRLIVFGKEEVRETEPAGLEEFHPVADGSRVSWLDVCGLHDLRLVEELGRRLGIHPLALEDLLNTEQRPKLDDYDDYLFLVLKMLSHDDASDEVVEEQVSLLVGTGYVVSFQERPGDVFDPVRERIRGGKGRVRRMDVDYLAYALVDAVVDHYFLVLEKLGERVEELERELVEDPGPGTARSIHLLKREMLALRRSVWPLREVVNAMGREGTSLVTDEVRIFVRDVYDHTIQVIDTTETLRDLVGGMLDTYLTAVSHRTNEVMKVLTIMATIFIPLTFVAGIYGMNFEWMPELGWKWGYPAVLALMATIGLAMVAYFRRRGWF